MKNKKHPIGHGAHIPREQIRRAIGGLIMRLTRRAVLFLLLSGTALWLPGCAGVGGPFPVHLRYMGELIKATAPPAAPRVVGLQAFENLNSEGDTLGHRIIGKGVQSYVSRPHSIAEAFTGATEKFLREKAHTVRSVSGWDYKPETLPRVGAGVDTVVSGKILRLFCKAEKKFARTNMILDADVMFIIGDVNNRQVVTRPVKIRLERTELTFDNTKLERFMNETLADLLQTGLGQLP